MTMLQEVPHLPNQSRGCQFQTLLLSKEKVANYNDFLPVEASIGNFLSGRFFLSGGFTEMIGPFFVQQSMHCFPKAPTLKQLFAGVELVADTPTTSTRKRKYKKYQESKRKQPESQNSSHDQHQASKDQEELVPKKEQIEKILQEVQLQRQYQQHQQQCQDLEDQRLERSNQYNIISNNSTPSSTIEPGIEPCQKKIPCVSASHRLPLTPVDLKKMSLFDAVPLLLQ